VVAVSDLLLQSATDVCDASVAGHEYLMDWEFIKAFSCTYANAAGFLVVGLFVYGGISLSIYIRTGSVVIPFVLLLLTGGAVMSQVASVAVGVATILLLVTGAGAITLLYQRYSQ
jgi:hypothetical protein